MKRIITIAKFFLLSPLYIMGVLAVAAPPVRHGYFCWGSVRTHLSGRPVSQ